MQRTVDVPGVWVEQVLAEWQTGDSSAVLQHTMTMEGFLKAGEMQTSALEHADTKYENETLACEVPRHGWWLISPSL
jgi:hypothetical protein